MGALATSAPDLLLTPTSLIGKADNSTLTQWDDESGNARHANGGTSPIVKTALLNGHSGVRFNGSSQHLVSTASTSGTEQTVIAVIVPAAGTFRTIRGGTSNSVPSLRVDNDNYLHVDSQGIVAMGENTFAALTAGSPHVVGMSYKFNATANQIALRTNGSNAFILSDPTALAASQTTYIGFRAGGAGTEYYAGDILLLASWSRRLTRVEWVDIEAELNTMFGLTPAFSHLPVLGGVATASTFAPGWPSYQLWDGLVGSTNESWSASAAPPQWVKLQLEEALTVTQYTVTARSDAPTSAPAAWTFEGSNDNSVWTTLDTRSAQSFSASQARSYTPTLTGSYLYYRLSQSATGGGAWPSFSELTFAHGVVLAPATNVAYWGIRQA